VEEDGWAGREVAIGSPRCASPSTERCVITMRDPDDGHGDLPILRALAGLRGKRDVAFGVWCDVATPGVVRVGDEVLPVVRAAASHRLPAAANAGAGSRARCAAQVTLPRSRKPPCRPAAARRSRR
jgi:hypothetical protein